MSEEEIEKFREEKALEIFRDKLEQEKKEIGRNSIFTIEYQIILDLIDKLQKENEDMRKELKVTSQMNSNLIVKLEKELENLKEVDRQICNEELITKDKYQEILKENEELKRKVKFYKDSFNNVYEEFEELRSENERLEKEIKL